MAIFGFSPFGYEGALVSVEVDLRRGIPAVDVVGLADGAVKESRERMKTAIRNSGFDFPQERVLISLSPADLKKEGAYFDLAIALAVLEKQQGIVQKESVLVYGELELSGDTRPVRGVYAALESAKGAGIRHAIISDTEESVPDWITAHKVGSLKEALAVYQSITDAATAQKSESKHNGLTFSGTNELDMIKGQGRKKFALAVAAAGRHNVLAYGAPGSGKTLLLRHFPELLPDLTDEELRSTTRIYSIAGMGGITLKARPFREPHQTASIEGMYGGGANLRPGEISLAHNGTLFLDETAEFRGAVLQMLRVPMESQRVALSRAGRTTTYPADFQLLMTTNPCPCGNYGVDGRTCLCSAHIVEQYWRKFGAPLLDRVEIRLAFQGDKDETDYTLDELRGMIKTAWETQLKRQGKLNGRLNIQEIACFCNPSAEAQKKLDEWTREEDLTQRDVMNLLRLSRTVADMLGNEVITLDDMITAGTLHGKLPVEF